MRIAIIHGYLLSGTGSNIYVANLASSLAERGHEVFLFCQEPEPQNFDFINDCYDFDADNAHFFRVFNCDQCGTGRVHLFRPRIGELLPVYVLDDYVGFTTREFHQLDETELANYVDRTSAAVLAVYRSFPFDLVQAHHLIASPAVARNVSEEVGVAYHVTIHGSALNYSVRRSQKLKDLSIYGLDRAVSVSASSHFLGNQLNDYLVEAGHEKVDVNVVYPGVELSIFRPENNNINHLRDDLKERKVFGKSAGLKEALNAVVSAGNRKLLDEELSSLAVYERRAPDGDLIDVLTKIDWRNDQIVAFVGKYLVGKGLHALILAAPIILKEAPNARFLALGFSDQREVFEALLAALATNQGDIVVDLVERLEKSISPQVGRSFIANLIKEGNFANYLEGAAAQNLEERFIFTGPLDHFELAKILAASSLFVAPSIFPEAFGMVAVEALASGIYPIVTNAFGMAEIDQEIRKKMSGYFINQPNLGLNDRFVVSLAQSIFDTLANVDIKGTKFRAAAHQMATDLFSWDRVAEDYIEIFDHGRKTA